MGELLDFSVYAKEDLDLDHVKIARRVAAADASVDHGEIGCELSANAGRADLIASMTLGVKVAKVPRGKAIYGKSLDQVRSSALGGFAKISTDLRPNLRKIFEFANACGGARSNTTITRTCRPAGKEVRSPENCSIRIQGRSALNIAELSSAQIANVTSYTIEIPRGTSLVTNLPETRIGIFRDVRVDFDIRSASSPSVTRVFWNFPSAESLEFTGTRFRGTVVASDASVRVRGQTGDAGFWVRELKASDSNW